LERTVDVGVFLQWLQAVRDDMDAGLVNASGPYLPDPRTLSGFVAARFRPEFKPAFDKWIASRPLLSTEAASTPFQLPEYAPTADLQVERFSGAAELHGNNAQEAIEHGEQYVLLTTLFAVALVLASIGSKLKHVAASLIMLGVAGVIIVGAAVALVTFPVEI